VIASVVDVAEDRGERLFLPGAELERFTPPVVRSVVQKLLEECARHIRMFL
jgi:hypothetical protein